LWDSITHVMNTSKQKIKTIHLPLLPTDIAVMLTSLPTGVNNVVTTVKNTGKSTAAWTVVPVPRASLDGCGEKKIFPLPEFAPPSNQPVVSCHTEYSTRVPFGARDKHSCFCQRNMCCG